MEAVILRSDRNNQENRATQSVSLPLRNHGSAPASLTYEFSLGCLCHESW